MPGYGATVAGAQRPWRLVTGMVVAAVFTVGFGVAGMVAVDDDLVRVTATDGRDVPFGMRWPGGLDLCVTDASTVDAGGELPNCYREPVDEASAVKQPVSTATTAAFVVIGLAILWSADRRDGEHTWFEFQVFGRFGRHQRHHPERSALQVDLGHHAVLDHPGDQPGEAVAGALGHW